MVFRDRHKVDDVDQLLTSKHHTVSDKGIKTMTVPPGFGWFPCKIVSILCDHCGQWKLNILSILNLWFYIDSFLSVFTNTTFIHLDLQCVQAILKKIRQNRHLVTLGRYHHSDILWQVRGLPSDKLLQACNPTHSHMQFGTGEHNVFISCTAYLRI